MKACKHLITAPLRGNHYLMVNCLSGAVDFLPLKDYLNLKNGRYNNLSFKLMEKLRERGHLFFDEADQNNFVKNISHKYRQNQNSAVVFTMCPSYACNLNCPYCFQKDVQNKYTYLSSQSVPFLIKAISQLSGNSKQPKVIQLFGGEPFLPKNKDFIDHILAYADYGHIPVAATTNGTMILKYRQLIKKYANVIKMMQITIDGPPEIHDKRRVPKNGQPTFDLILKGIKFLVDCKISVQARVNVDRTNIESLPMLASYLKENKMLESEYFKCVLAPVQNHCSKDTSKDLMDEHELINRLEDLGAGYPDMQYLSYNRIPKTIMHIRNVLNGEYSSPHLSFCEANRGNYFIFGPDGLIYPCSEAAGHTELAVGRFLPDFGLFEEKYNQWTQKNIFTADKCKDCNIAPLCGGGCSFAAYKINGSLDDPYCSGAKEIIMKYIEDNKEELFKKASATL